METKISLQGDIVTSVITSAQKDTGYYVPIFRIKITSQGVTTNSEKGYIMFRVISFSNDEVFYKDYSLLVSTGATNDCTLLDLKYKEQLITVFAYNNDGYVTIYAKSVSSTSGYPIWVKFLHSPNKPFIDELPWRNCDIDKDSLTAGTIIEPTVINKPLLAWLNGWTSNIDATYTTKITETFIEFDVVSVRVAIKSGTTVDGTIIGTISPIPWFNPIKVIGHTLTGTTYAHCTISIESNGDMKIYDVATNDLVMFDFSYRVYY